MDDTTPVTLLAGVLGAGPAPIVHTLTAGGPLVAARIVLAKSDLTSPARIAALQERLRRFDPGALVRSVADDVVAIGGRP